MGMFEKKDISLILQYTCFAIGIVITIIFIIFFSITILKKKNHSLHTNISFSGNNDTEIHSPLNILSDYGGKKAVNCKLIVNYYETRIDLIHKSKYFIYSPFMLLYLLGALIILHELPDFYLGIFSFSFYLAFNIIQIIMSNIDLVKKHYNFTMVTTTTAV